MTEGLRDGFTQSVFAADPMLRLLANRRSTIKFADTPVPRGDIEIALDFGVRAPNHRRTRPWRFVVVTGDGRHRLGEKMASAAIRLGQDGERARNKAFAAPVIVCAWVSPQLDNPKVLAEEEVLAVGAAVENILLALHAVGLGSIWTTGSLIATPEVREFFGLTAPQERIVALIYVGYSNDGVRENRLTETNVPFTRWIESA
jgi:nitroreductase